MENTTDSAEQMDVEEPQTPVMTCENVANTADKLHAVDLLEIEKEKHQRTMQALQRLESQLDLFAEKDFQSNQYIQLLENSSSMQAQANSALAQEVMRLRNVQETLNAAIQLICLNLNCGNSTKGR
ncbi:hypothetical protein V501_00018 [Pseudogymnoascus sp. VKM F-4519 (FW-2642)]|nr:hypothetical protein V501_00018 [Pseudogymnoascus sp. VKM F-4519 (FW-2642)]